jgi:hypothetical protein
LAALGEKRLVVLDVREESWRETACRLANRNLTEAEWNRFLGAQGKYRETCPGQGFAAK